MKTRIVPRSPKLLYISPPARSQGFTLIETLVAMMLLAISLVVILQLFSGGLKSGKIAEDYTRAVFYAREKMEEHLLSEDFQEGVFEGSIDDNYRWRVDITFSGSGDEDEHEVSLVDLFVVETSVFWSVGERERTFQISTLKIAEKRYEDE